MNKSRKAAIVAAAFFLLWAARRQNAPSLLAAETGSLFDGSGASATPHPMPGPAPAAFGVPAPIPTSTPSPQIVEPTVTIGGSSLTPLVDGNAFSAASLATIKNAKSSIDLEMFFFFDKTLVDAIAARAKDIPVRIVLDPFLGHTIDVLTVAKARLAGAEVVFYPTWALHGALYRIDHAKLLIADGKQAVVGGANWSEKLRQDHDFNLLLAGPVVSRLQGVFNQAYALAKNQTPPALPTPSYDPNGDIQVLVTDGQHEEPLQAIVHQINKAHRIRAEELLLDDEHVVDALLSAKARGADIELLLDPNSFLMGGVNAPIVKRLQAVGIPVRFFNDPTGQQKLLHAKLAIFDKSTIIVGSANWSHNSLEVNRELALLFSNAQVGADLEKVFDDDWNQRSASPPPEHHGIAGALQQLANALAKLLS